MLRGDPAVRHVPRAIRMKTITAMVAKSLGKFLANDFRQMFGSAQQDTAERLGSLARSTIECLGRSAALDENGEHRRRFPLGGCYVLWGRTLTERIQPTDYDPLIESGLLPDVWDVRGI